MRLAELVSMLDMQLNELQNAIQKIEWHNLSSKNFMRELESSINKLERIHKTIQGIELENMKNPKPGMPATKELLELIEKELEFMKRNLSLEEKKADIRVKEINEFEEERTTELYSEIQQRIQGILVKARFFLERVNIFMKKHELNVVEQKSFGENLLELLERKEKELQELKEKFAEMKKKSVLGISIERTIAETEHKFIEDFIELKKQVLASEKELEVFQKNLKNLNEAFDDLKAKQKQLLATTKDIKNKALVLVTELKKERDYARNALLEIETETLKLRNTYTTQMLEVEGEKVKAKRETEIKYEALLKRLRQQLEDKDSLIKSLQEVIDRLNEDKNKKRKSKEAF